MPTGTEFDHTSGGRSQLNDAAGGLDADDDRLPRGQWGPTASYGDVDDDADLRPIDQLLSNALDWGPVATSP